MKATIKILLILLFFTNLLLAKNASDSTLLKTLNYSLSIASIRILNNKWSTQLQVSKNKFGLLLALDYQQKYIPLKKALLFYDLDYARYISYKIGGFYKFKKNSIFKNVGLCFYNRYSNNTGKKERVKMVYKSDTTYYYSIDEKIKSFGLLISTTSQIKITKQFSILISPFIGFVQRYQMRENNSSLKNTIYDKRYINTKNVIHADLYTCLSCTF